MEKYAWSGYIKQDKIDEYISRHNNIWPEMVEVLKKAGISNYSIWLKGNQVFGYYECEKGSEYSSMVQKTSEVVDKWNKYMEDILILEMDPDTGAQPKLVQVFNLK